MVTAIGARIRTARERAVYGQRELARAAGISADTLCQIEHGKHQPRPATIRKLAAALGLQPWQLVGEPQEGPSTPR